MTCFDDDELTKEEGYPCECGGSITLNTDNTEEDFWECDSCSFTATKAVRDTSEIGEQS